MNLWQDLQYGARMLRTNPGFTTVAVLTLALGIGANTAIFSLINAFLLRPLPVPEPQTLVNIYTSNPDGAGYSTSSYPDFADLRQMNEVFSGVIGYAGINVSVTGDGRPELIFGEMVSGNYFSALGVQPVQGRAFLPEEDRTPGTHPVAVISHGLWQRRFGSAPDMVGKSIVLNGHLFTVIGVAPADFKGLLAPGLAMDVWTPIMMVGALRQGTEALSQRNQRWLSLKGRLQPGVSIAQAQAAAGAVARRLEQAYPESNEKRAVKLLATSSVHIHPSSDGKIFSLGGLLMIVVGLVLLVACSNLANLLLARLTSRRREIAVRLALGATRGRLLRQFLAESLLLSLCGGAVGLLLAFWLVNLLVTFKPPLPVPLSLDVAIDTRVLACTLLLTVVTGVFFGLTSAFQTSKPDLAHDLKEEGTQLRVGQRRFSFRNLLIVTQVAASLVLLVAAGLFVRSLQKAGAVAPGFDTDHAAIISFNLGLHRYQEDQGRRFYERFVERTRALPGAQEASLTDRLPLSNLGPQSAQILIEGRNRGDQGTTLQYARISPRYFRTLGIPLRQGRDFTPQDDGAAPPVAIINKAAARAFWPNQSPLGQHLQRDGKLLEVVGVVEDTKVAALNEEAQPYLYLPFVQNYSPLMQVVVQAADNPATMLAPLRHLAREIDENVAIFQLKTMPEHMGVELYPLRLTSSLLTLFGLLALLLASMGLYGVMAFSVSQRTRELGIRLALGAQRRDIFKLIIGQGLVLTLIGVGVGLGVSLAVTQLLSSWLFGISATDPLTFAGVSVFLIAVAALACYLPARRATKVDPMVALRYE